MEVYMFFSKHLHFAISRLQASIDELIFVFEIQLIGVRKNSNRCL
jgi:hypothetical protein